MSFDIEPANRTDPISKEEYYELRLRPVKDFETGITEDEIDRLEHELAMKKLDIAALKVTLKYALSELENAGSFYGEGAYPVNQEIMNNLRRIIA